MYLLPDKSKAGKRKTKVKKHTLNPIFEEILKVNIFIKTPIENSKLRPQRPRYITQLRQLM